MARGTLTEGLAAALLALAVGQPAAGGEMPVQLAQTAACPATFVGHGAGEVIDCVCPDADAFAPVWGTATYTSDSSICTAARHAGLIGSYADGVVWGSGGPVRVQGLGGCDAYAGSTRNGIPSAAYGPWTESFHFPAASAGGCVQAFAGAPEGGTTVAACPATGDGLAAGARLDCLCPAGAAGDVWGSGPYLASSALCAAARHAGLVGDGGGQVAVAGSAGCERYSGGIANGVTTYPYGAWATSFHFPAVGGAGCPAAEYYSLHFVGLQCLDEADPFFLEDFDSVLAVAFVVEADGAIQEARVLPREDEWYGRMDAGQVIAQDIRVWQGLAQDVTLHALLYKYDPVLPEVMRMLVSVGSGIGGALVAIGTGGAGAAAGVGAAAAGQLAADAVHQQLSQAATPLGHSEITIELTRVGDPASQPLQQAGPVSYHFATEHNLRGARYLLFWQVRR